jgi:DNA-binding transcriptional LysR family regulator
MSEVDELRTFVASVRRGSFAAAARYLNISAAMVGRRIQSLEDRYQAKLIERTTRTQRLTERGEQFLPRAEILLQAFDALHDFPTSGELSGRIRLSGPITLGTTRLPPIIARFATEHPKVRLEMTLSDRRVDLIAEDYDLAVRIGQLQASSMVSRRLGTYRFVCCAAPGFLARNGAPKHPSELVDATCVVNLNLFSRSRWTFENTSGSPVTVEVNGSIQLDNDEAQRAIAIEGGGIVYLPFDLVQRDLEEGRLVQILPGWRLPTMPIRAVYPSKRLMPRAVAAFVTTLAENLEPH